MSQFKTNDRIELFNLDDTTKTTYNSTTSLGSVGDIVTGIFIDADTIGYTMQLQHYANELTSVTYVSDKDRVNTSLVNQAEYTAVGCYIPGTQDVRQPVKLSTGARLQIVLASFAVGQHLRVSIQTVTPFG